MQFVRFYYKEKEKVNAKILKVKRCILLFPFIWVRLYFNEVDLNFIYLNRVELAIILFICLKNVLFTGEEQDLFISNLRSQLESKQNETQFEFHPEHASHRNYLFYCLFHLQDVKFPLTLDVFDLCSPELQQKLAPMRELFKEQEDKLAMTAKVGFSKFYNSYDRFRACVLMRSFQG